MVYLAVAIPSSVLDVEHGLLLKTIRIHQFLRFSSIFGVEELVVYRDGFTKLSDHQLHVELFREIHSYLTTPPYLRKKIIKRSDKLSYVGTLPPLRLLAYSVSNKGRVGERRVGLARENGYVDVGLGKGFRIVNIESCIPIKDRLVYVEIIDLDRREAKCLEEKPYLGPVLRSYGSLREVVEKYRNKNFYTIATSKWGLVPSSTDLLELRKKEFILVLFGSPRKGLFELARKEGFALEDRVNAVWKTIVNQMVKTVRTEEALIGTLSILNIFINASWS